MGSLKLVQRAPAAARGCEAALGSAGGSQCQFAVARHDTFGGDNEAALRSSNYNGAFLRAAEQADRQVRTLCMTLAFARCRLSEALALTVDRVDPGLLVLESIKKCRSAAFIAP